MPFISEKDLIAQIKSSNFGSIYVLFGDEAFLIKTYKDRITNKILGKVPSDFDFVNLGSNFTTNELEEAVEGLPFTSDYKMIFINDYDVDKDLTDDFNKKLKILEDAPDYSIIIFTFYGVKVDIKKLKAKMKKLINLADNHGFVCEFKHMSSNKVADLIVKRCLKKNITISKENAMYLSDILGNSLQEIGLEVDKLCSYVMDKGIIDKKDIDNLVPKQAEAKIFALADSVLSGDKSKTFKILDDLLWNKIEPFVIISVLSSSYLDLYRAILAVNEGKNPKQVISDFSYPKNREFLITKAFNKARNINIDYIKNSIKSLFLADFRIKTSSLDTRVVLEQAITKLLAVRR